MAWLTRTDLVREARTSEGLLVVSPEADVVLPLGADDRRAALDLAAKTLAAAGIGATDRVVVALNNDGEPTGTLIARAAAETAAAAASVGPRGRTRLHHALEVVRATTLVSTPTGAMDLLARLHLEFLLDPLDLGLDRIVTVGEIPSPGTRRQLASEFEAEVVELYADPFFGVPTAYRDSTAAPFVPVRDGLLGLAPPAEDVSLAPPYPPGLAEIVLTPTWHSRLADAVLRTGHAVRLAGGEDPIPAPGHTVGEHLLIRGRWVSVPRVAEVLSRIDGIAHWDLRVGRAGTLDSAVVRVTFNRETLVANPMWKSRIAQALVTATPVTIDVAVEDEIAEETRPGSVTDLRGHHLGRDRSALTE